MMQYRESPLVSYTVPGFSTKTSIYLDENRYCDCEKVLIDTLVFFKGVSNITITTGIFQF